MSLDHLVQAMHRAGLEPTARELAESLWLATQMAAADRGPPAAPPTSPRPLPEPVVAPPPVHLPEPAPPAPVPLYSPRPARRPERPPGEARAAGTVEVPKPIALADRLAFQRALRPLLRRVPAPGLGTLDEEATARRAADMPAGHPWPAVLRPADRLWLDAAVVVDRGDSMAIWQDLAADIVDVLRESGAFRQVARYRLAGADETGAAVVTDWTGRPLPAARLIDPGNRRVIFVISDCVGPAWRSGGAARVLHEWGHHGPVAILQPLPERLWARTAARTIAGTLVAPRACAPNSTLKFTAFGGRDRPQGTLVPVLEVDRTWLRRWTGLIAGGPGITAAVTVATGRPPEPAPVPPAPALSAEQRVRLFRAAASEEAFRLARYVAVGDPQIDVIRHVHYAMFKPAYPAHLAEVLLSGLLRVEDGRHGWYSFVEQVPDVLLSTLSISETVHATQLLEEVSASVNRQMAGNRARLKVRTPGEGAGTIGGHEAPFAVTPLARRRLEMARARLQRHAEPPPLPPPDDRGPAEPTEKPRPERAVDPAELVSPGAAVVRFVQRGDELDRILNWARSPEPAMTLWITGPAGIGKTRLALEVAAQLGADGWRVAKAGAPTPPDDNPLLIIADSGDGDLAVDDLIAEVDDGEPRGSTMIGAAPVRVLALARYATAAEQGPRSTPSVRLTALDGSSFYWTAVTDLAEHLGAAQPANRDHHGGTPGAVVLAALEAVDSSLASAAADALAQRERLLAERSTAGTGISFAEHRQLDAYLAAAQLFGARSATEAREVARLAGGLESYEASRQAADWLQRLHPGEGQEYWRLLPEPLRERLVVPALLRDPAVLGLLPSVSAQQAGRAIELLVRAARGRRALAAAVWAAAVQRPELCTAVLDEARRTGGPDDDLLELARATVADESTPVAVLRAVVEGVPGTEAVFTGQSAGRAAALADGYRRLAVSSAPHRSALADAAYQMGMIAERDGRDDEALRTVEWEIDLRQRLAGAEPGNSRAQAALARARTTHAARLDRAGRPVQGNAAITGALAIYQRLGDEYADQEAYARVRQARLLAQLGHLAEAAEAAREATTRYRRLRSEDPRHAAGLAGALLVEAATARARDQRDTAVTAGAEAVDLYERLAADDAERYRARLAYACAAHGMDLGEYRSHTAGLDRLDRAAGLYRGFDPAGLAAVQLGRGLLLGELERYDEAIGAFAEAVALHRRLGPRDRALAGALAAQAQVTAAAGGGAEAVALLTEACVLRDQLHAADPVDAGLRREVATGYDQLAALHERLGNTEEAAQARVRARLMG
ncbi:SAV_2336 N-terminal domain-related protein [Actinoplanes sp. NPDC049596]|uniref:SAV_2336 N-terminal domain-related protein n=1 Tax=unclassified Actinoplanes TaxID=2626549 RepID=UPI003440D93B